MSYIRSSADIKERYSEISKLCREHQEPVFITEGGQEDLAVMSVEFFESLSGELELYRLLDEGREAVRAGRTRPAKDVLRDIRQEIVDGKI